MKSLFKIAENWENSTKEDSTFFLGRFYKKFPNAARENMVSIRPIKGYDFGMLRIYLKNDPEIVYRIDSNDEFRQYRVCGCSLDECEDSCGTEDDDDFGLFD